MISIKEHNDIVQKLMKELQSKESQFKQMQKEKIKSNLSPQLQPTLNEKQLQGKITQLNKEYKQKIGLLTQQLRSKSNENKDLKERLTLKTNLQVKQKDHIAEVMRKNIDRKPSSAQDYKVSALVAHYEEEIAKKVRLIEGLQKQLKQLQAQSTKSIPPEEDENYKDTVVNEEKSKGISMVEHQRQLGRVKMQAGKYKKMLEEKEKEYRDLNRRYTELTNQYYKIINSYGLEDKSSLAKQKSQQFLIPQRKRKEQKAVSSNNALHNLLHQMAVSDTETEQQQSFSSTRLPQRLNNHNDEQSESECYLSKLEEISKLLQVQIQQIIPTICKIKAQFEDYQLLSTIARSLQVFFYNIGKGKLTRNELTPALQQFHLKYTRNQQSLDLLDELCIEVGAKRDKLIDKIRQLVHSREIQLQQAGNLKYLQEMGKANKMVQFIEFFELDRNNLQLPQQLVQMHDQLRALQKYIGEVRVLLEIDAEKSGHMVLELALRYMEKASTIIALYEKRKAKNSM